MNNTEYYSRLGIDKNASPEEIKKAYRKLSKQYHPDINKDAGAEDKYKEIQEAYETLGDEQKRASYDQFGSAGANGGFGGQGQGGFSGFEGFSGGGFGGFEDIFSSFFGGGQQQANPSGPRQGDDLQYRVNLKFEEAIFGTEKEIKYNREENCHTCEGSGAKAGTQPETCQKCQGRGQINVVRDTPLGRMQSTTVCDVCHGTGKEIKEKCTTCHGSGHEKSAHTVKVTVPAGVESGQQMRLQGQGDAGVNGGPYGDLYVRFQVEASKQFERDGSEIFYEMPLEFVQATLGDEIEIPTVHGEVKLKIPAGTQTGTNFRLKGKGAPKLRGSGNGDQHVVVNIVTPKKLNNEQKEALQAFAQASGHNLKSEKKGLFK
ncbi:MAG: molecular chaperone DnaJ [Streptococcaceae bacterium]|nr:molecular chaperone DnaJ [Streptococcaceae bacterium]